MRTITIAAQNAEKIGGLRGQTHDQPPHRPHPLPDRQRDIMGVFAEHFRTLSAPNKWAKQKALFARGGIQCVTLHKERGETKRSKVNLTPLLLQDLKK